MSIDKIIELIRKDAQKVKTDAGMGGRWDDGGASQMEDQIKFYLYGRDGIIPPEWKKYETQLDPEYQEYLRLSKKFHK